MEDYYILLVTTSLRHTITQVPEKHNIYKGEGQSLADLSKIYKPLLPSEVSREIIWAKRIKIFVVIIKKKKNLRWVNIVKNRTSWLQLNPDASIDTQQ